MEVTKKELLDQIQLRFNSLLSSAEKMGLGDESISAIESNMLSMLLSLGLMLLKYVICLRNQSVANKLSSSIQSGLLVKGSISSKGNSSRKYLSIFGELSISRKRYHQIDVGYIYPLDKSLNLPLTTWSYLLQKWVGSQSSSINYTESVSLINEILGLRFSGHDAKTNCKGLSAHVNAYYDKYFLSSAREASIHVIGFDGKGVPIILDEMPKDERPRLGKGEKRGRKKMATVSVNATISPKVRTAQDIINALFRKMNANKDADTSPKPNKHNNTAPLAIANQADSSPKWYDNIHRRAFLSNQEKAIEYGVKRLKKQVGTSSIVALVDGGNGLESSILNQLAKHNLQENLLAIVIDIIHVEEYVWKAANIILGHNSTLRLNWVENALLDLLLSKTDKFIDQLKDNQNKTSLSDAKAETLASIITYFENHKHKMDYANYLSKGLPISTAIVEGTCKHLVKDRMEGSGMRWEPKGAQNMMDMRAVKINHDWEAFMNFVQQQNNNTRLKFAA